MRVLLTAVLASLFLTVDLAAEIGLSDPSGRGGWLLLQEPLGPGGEGLDPFAGDPGLPVPDALQWPFTGQADGRYPPTELWRYDGERREFRQATRVLGRGDENRHSFRRTLYAVFGLDNTPYVLHFHPYGANVTQVLKVGPELERADGAVPGGSVVLDSDIFLDAPAVSPDGRHVAFRAFRREKDRFVATIHVYRVHGWTLRAESAPVNAGRPVWISNEALALIEFDGVEPPQTPQRDPAHRALQVLESHTPAPGRLLRLDFDGESLEPTTLLAGAFPPDRLSRSVAADPAGLGLLVARADGKELLVEQREPRPGARAREIARYDFFRGMAVGARRIRIAGVRDLDGAPTLFVTSAERFGLARIGGLEVRLPLGNELEIDEGPIRAVSAEAHGTLIDLGRAAAAILEPVVSPHFDAANRSGPLLAHTLFVPDWPGCDNMRNPRVLTRLSALVGRFAEVAGHYGGEIPSTLLVFDLEINDRGNEKRGRYIELYGRAGRGGSGRIRTEDNLSGDWLVQAIDGSGREADDRYYVCDNIRAGEFSERPAEDAGRAYRDLVTQLETRKLLMLANAEYAVERGGLRFLGRDVHRDPTRGLTWRVWVYEKFGRELPDGSRERVELRFVAGLPVGAAGTWEHPHGLARARVRFGLTGRDDAALTDLAFEPNSFVELPNLTDRAAGMSDTRPALLLPAVFRVFETEDGRLVQRLEARAVTREFEHPRQLIRAGLMRAGYDVPGANFGNRQFTRLAR